MSNNLFISYALNVPDQCNERVAEAIQALGPWAKIHASHFYVRSALSAEQAAHQIRTAMAPSDQLLVVDAVNNLAHWFNLDDAVARQMHHYWRA